jgi:hypothetical protein
VRKDDTIVEEDVDLDAKCGVRCERGVLRRYVGSAGEWSLRLHKSRFMRSYARFEALKPPPFGVSRGRHRRKPPAPLLVTPDVPHIIAFPRSTWVANT